MEFTALVQAIITQRRESFLCANPFWSAQEAQDYQQLINKYQRDHHIWVASSGSEAHSRWSNKLVALSQSAVLNSAEAVNRHLQIARTDSWIQVLPEFHVGGLGVLVRAKLAEVQVFQGLKSEAQKLKWDPQFFLEQCHRLKPTLSAMVPTQIHDIVQLGAQAPKSLRAIVIGGAALAPHLYKSARALGWPLLPSFGMTECSSQIATAEIASLEQSEFPSLKILPHCQIRCPQGLIEVSSISLLTEYLQKQGDDFVCWNPKKDDWFLTQDLGATEGPHLQVQGRSSRYIKIMGEGVSLDSLTERWQSVAPELSLTTTLTSREVLREQNEIVMVRESEADLSVFQKAFTEFNKNLKAIERVKAVVEVGQIPRSSLGKVLWSELQEIINRKT